MSSIYTSLFLRLGWKVLRRRSVRYGLPAVLGTLWLLGVPLIRLSYSAVVFPLRATQYYFSPDRRDALRLADLAGMPAERRFLERLGLWSVLRAMRNEKLSSKHQAITLAIVQQESSFRFYAKNRQSSACGLFQLIAGSGELLQMPWWRCMDPVANTAAGVAFVRSFLNRGPSELRAAARCAYLRHYYGPRSNCSDDTQGIWKQVGARLIGQSAVFLRAIEQIERERVHRGIFARVWHALGPYLPFALVAFCFVGWRKAVG